MVMRKIESLTLKKWNKMWRLWRKRKLDTPLDELVTYYNAMCHGHAFYFKQFKGNNSEVRRHMWIIKQYIPENHYNNLKEAYELYESIKDKGLTPFEEENAFLKNDENYFLDDYFLHLIIWDLLTYYPHIVVPISLRKPPVVINDIEV